MKNETENASFFNNNNVLFNKANAFMLIQIIIQIDYSSYSQLKKYKYKL